MWLPGLSRRSDSLLICFFFAALIISFPIFNLVALVMISVDYFFLESKATYTVEEAIDKMGYGPFQVKLMLVIGLAWVSL